MPGPITVITASANRIIGSDDSESKISTSTASSQRGPKPETIPSSNPTMPAIPVASKAMDRAVRAPQMMRDSVSRPNWSVPAQWVSDGPMNLFGTSIFTGSNGATHGASSAIRTKVATSTSPINPIGSATSALSAPLSPAKDITHPRVQFRNQQIGGGDDKQVKRRHEQHSAHHHRIIALLHRVGDEGADAGP